MLVTEFSFTLTAIERRLVRDIMTLCIAMCNDTLESFECPITILAFIGHSGRGSLAEEKSGSGLYLTMMETENNGQPALYSGIIIRFPVFYSEIRTSYSIELPNKALFN